MRVGEVERAKGERELVVTEEGGERERTGGNGEGGGAEGQ